MQLHHLLLNKSVGLWRDETAQELIEYALLATLIAVAAITSMLGYASSLKSLFAWVGQKLVS